MSYKRVFVRTCPPHLRSDSEKTSMSRKNPKKIRLLSDSPNNLKRFQGNDEKIKSRIVNHMICKISVMSYPTPDHAGPKLIYACRMYKITQ